MLTQSVYTAITDSLSSLAPHSQEVESATPTSQMYMLMTGRTVLVHLPLEATVVGGATTSDDASKCNVLLSLFNPVAMVTLKDSASSVGVSLYDASVKGGGEDVGVAGEGTWSYNILQTCPGAINKLGLSAPLLSLQSSYEPGKEGSISLTLERSIKVTATPTTMFRLLDFYTHIVALFPSTHTSTTSHHEDKSTNELFTNIGMEVKMKQVMLEFLSLEGSDIVDKGSGVAGKGSVFTSKGCGIVMSWDDLHVVVSSSSEGVNGRMSVGCLEGVVRLAEEAWSSRMILPLYLDCTLVYCMAGSEYDRYMNM